MKIKGIYKIRNCINGKIYIGQSIDILGRFNDHKANVTKKFNYHLYKSFRKYGLENFEFIIFEKVDNILLLDSREQYWMDFYNSYNPEFGYNICKLATSTKGYKHTEETRKKISQKSKGRVSPNKGKNLLSLEQRKAQSLYMKNKWQDNTYINKVITKIIESCNKEEFKIRQAQKTKECWDTPGYRQLQSESHKKAFLNNPELYNKVSETHKNLWKNLEYRNKQIEKRKIKRKLLNFDKVKNLYLIQNFNMKETAKLLGVCKDTLSNFIKENNLHKPYSAYVKNKIKDCDINNLIDNNVNIGVI